MRRGILWIVGLTGCAAASVLGAPGEVTLAELQSRYPDVSSMTLRRDLENLERRGDVVRIRGGAKSIAHLSMLKEAAYTQRQTEHAEAKLAIARKAVALLSPGRSIYIDSGTTCTCFAQRVPDQSLFVLTPAPNVALELVKVIGLVWTGVELVGG